MMEGEPRKQWFTLESHEGKTSDVCLRLCAAGFEVWRPFIVHRINRRTKGSDRGERRIERKFPRFGRYFFLRCVLTDSLYHEVAHLPHLRGFLCMPGTRTPFPVPDREIEWLRHNVPERPERGWEERFHKGQRVRITAGPMEGMIGQIQSLDRRGLAKLDVENRFGPSVPVLVEIAHVEPVNAQAQPPAGLNDVKTRLIKSSAGA